MTRDARGSVRRACGTALALLLAGCATLPAAEEATRAPEIGADAVLVPAGFGTLRQDDMAIRLTLPGGLQVRAAPLDESFIRLLSPDAYRAMQELVRSQAGRASTG